MLEICDEKEKSSLYFSVRDDGIADRGEEKQKLISRFFEQAALHSFRLAKSLLVVQKTKGGRCDRLGILRATSTRFRSSMKIFKDYKVISPGSKAGQIFLLQIENSSMEIVE